MLGVLLPRLTDQTGTGQLGTFLNPHSYLLMRKHHELLRQFDAIFVDGIALVWALRLVGVRVRRCSLDMTSLARELLGVAARSGQRVAFVGGPPGAAARAKDVLEGHFEGLDVVFTRSGFFEDAKDRGRALELLSDTSPDLVLAGLGAGPQEKFLVDLRGLGWNGSGYTCGAFLEQVSRTGAADYYPPVFDRLNVRWLYRLFEEPRLLYRYAVRYPCFVAVFVVDVLSWVRRR